jgi:hypothetical protein
MFKPNNSDQLKIDHLKELFFNREDSVVLEAPWGKPCPALPVGDIDRLVTAHVMGEAAPPAKAQFLTRDGASYHSGHFRIGSFSQTVESMSRWVCIDIDGPGHAWPVADPDHAATTIMELLLQYGFNPYFERSFSNYGGHLWCFFDRPVHSEVIIDFFRNLIPENILLQDGSFADPKCGKGIEIFPKFSKVRPDGYGSMVWLPWYNKATGGANEFHILTQEGELKPSLPTEFLLTDPDLLITVRLPGSRSSSMSGLRYSLPGSATHDSWREWRKDVLAVFDLDRVYGKYLTGIQKSTGWYECRDPDSPTGDQNPSAGVGTGKDGVERGRFNSFRSGEGGMSVFDFLVKYHPDVQDFKAAQRFLRDLTGIPFPKKRKSTQVQKRIVRPDNSRFVTGNRQDRKKYLRERWGLG